MPRLAPCLFLALLTACGSAPERAAAPDPVDAAVVDALADPIMTDPDLTMQNQANAAVTVSGPASSALPPIDRSDEAIGAARDAAARLTGGTPPALPDPAAEDLKALRGAVTAAQMAQVAKIGRGDCVNGVSYTARWAALLPDALQPYPRGAVEDAAGTDQAGCGLRVVHYKTPVPLAEVLAFHHARLRTAGYGLRLAGDGDDRVLRASKDGSAAVIYLRLGGDGLTVVDVVVAG